MTGMSPMCLRAQETGLPGVTVEEQHSSLKSHRLVNISTQQAKYSALNNSLTKVQLNRIRLTLQNVQNGYNIKITV